MLATAKIYGFSLVILTQKNYNRNIKYGDFLMDNNMQPFAPQPSARPSQNPQPDQPAANPAASASPSLDPQIPPAVETPDYQPAQTASLSEQGQNQPVLNNTGVNLESPILAPTHFDGMKAPNIPVGQAAAPTQTLTNNTAPTLTPEQKKTKLFVTLSVVFGALAFIGIILGIWSLISNIDVSNKLQKAQSQLKVADSIIKKVEEDTGTTINSVDAVPDYNSVAGTIYLPEWGIKFKIPDDLENVSFTLDQKYRPQICFTGHKSGIKMLPGFADIDQNQNGLGCVTRVASSEGDTDKDSNKNFGQKIFTYDDYNYFYVAPEGHFSQDAAEQGLEEAATQSIKDMISTIAHYQ